MTITPEHLAAVARLLPDSATDVVQEMAAVLYASLPARLAHRDALAVALVDAVRGHFGGAQIYIPKPGAEQVSERNRQIYAAFNGRNYMQLAREFDLTERHVRDIVEACRAADVATRQKDLF